MRRAPFMVVETGVNSAEVNNAMDRAWLVGHAEGERANLLRFYRSPPSAWLGLHQWPERELRLLYCHRKGIDVVRRLTGGGTLYVDEHQLGFSLIIKWSERLAGHGETAILQRGCQAVAAALQGFGVDAVFKAPNDIEVRGRKLASLFISRYRGSILLQGVLLMTVDSARVLGALRLPTEPASAHGHAPAVERLTALDRLLPRPPAPARLRKALADALAAAFNLGAQSSTKTVYATVRDIARPGGWPAGLDRPLRIPTATTYWRELAATQTGMAEAFWRAPIGLLRARLRWDTLRQAPRDLEIGGHVQVYPLNLFQRLAEELAGVSRAELPAHFAAACDRLHARLVGFSRADLLELLERVWDRAEQQRRFGLTVEQANRLTLVGAADAAAAESVVARADTLLLPYCVRPPECRERPLADCLDCSGCEVGQACRTAQEYGLTVRESTASVAFETLLAELSAEGSTGVVGMTCQTFFIKHGEVFERAGLPLVLMDIGGTTCYELQQEAIGYGGRFPYKTTLDIPVLEKVVRAKVGAADGADGRGAATAGTGCPVPAVS